MLGFFLHEDNNISEVKNQFLYTLNINDYFIYM